MLILSLIDLLNLQAQSHVMIARLHPYLSRAGETVYNHKVNKVNKKLTVPLNKEHVETSFFRLQLLGVVDTTNLHYSPMLFKQSNKVNKSSARLTNQLKQATKP